MGIPELHQQVEAIERLVNLVTIDSISTGQSYIVDDVDPLKKVVHFPLDRPIPSDLQSRLRKMLKSQLWTDYTACGKVKYTPSLLSVGVYLKRLRAPAWTPKEKTEESS